MDPEREAYAGTLRAKLDELNASWAALLVALFGSYRWYRRYVHGGHWERWYVNDGQNRVWLYTGTCSLAVGGKRPHWGCLGTPTCEDWPAR